MDEVAKYNREGWEDLEGDASAPPGTWDHFKRIAPSFSLWAAYRPDV